MHKVYKRINALGELIASRRAHSGPCNADLWQPDHCYLTDAELAELHALKLQLHTLENASTARDSVQRRIKSKTRGRPKV